MPIPNEEQQALNRFWEWQALVEGVLLAIEMELNYLVDRTNDDH